MQLHPSRLFSLQFNIPGQLILHDLHNDTLDATIHEHQSPTTRFDLFICRNLFVFLMIPSCKRFFAMPTPPFHMQDMLHFSLAAGFFNLDLVLRKKREKKNQKWFALRNWSLTFWAICRLCQRLTCLVYCSLDVARCPIPSATARICPAEIV